MTKTIEIKLDLLLPDLESTDECVALLTQHMSGQKGIEKAHIVQENQQATLCLHFDPNLVSLALVQRLARDLSARISSRYRHERIAFARLNTADAGLSLERVLRELKGMIHASVNYAAGLIFVGYDTSVLQRSTIDAEIQGLGAKIVTSPQSQIVLQHDAEAGHDDDHDHGSAPAFLPHWMQERWTLILVGLAAVFFLAGWLGERFLGFSESAATVFYILAYIAGGYDVATHAIPALFKGKLDTDILMLAAAGGAALLGEFGEGAFLLLLFAIGHAGEHYALDRARNAISALGALMPKTAQLRRGDQIVETPVEQVQIDDVVVTAPATVSLWMESSRRAAAPSTKARSRAKVFR
ncbi:hypothetical protein QPK87_22680 [Kamptonema cortianum]|nr:hypothetical protein [Kamptonema cortianum]